MFSTVVILLLAVIAFASNRLPIGLVAIGVALSLFLTGVLTFEESIAGFGDPVVIYIAALFVVSEALSYTGVTTWAGQLLLQRTGKKISAVIIMLMLLVAFVTAFISVNGAVAALIPVGAILALRRGIAPSKLMLPLAFAAHAGSMLTLTGTPVNVLVSEMAVESGERYFGFIEFSLVGMPLVAGTTLIVVFLGPRVLPERIPKNASRDLSEYATALSKQYQLHPAAVTLDNNQGFIEVLIPPRSVFIGDQVFVGMRTESGDLVIEAIQRAGQNMGSTMLKTGDVLLLRGAWGSLDKRTEDQHLLVLDDAPNIRRQTLALGPRSFVAVGVLILMVIFLFVGLFPPAAVALLAASAMVLLRAISVEQAHRSISISTLLIVAGMIPLSTAIIKTGIAEIIADGLISFLGTNNPGLMLAGLVLVVVILGQFISNMATVLIVAPIALTVSEASNISVLPLLMGIAIAGAASFLTPVATPANTMVLGPGAYKFGDYWKLGLPILIFFVMIAVFLVPVIWKF